MDNKSEILEKKVKQLYESKHPDRDEWTDWLWANHVLWVADKAVVLAKEKGYDPELCRTVALLHDIADTEMDRGNPSHEDRSLEIAQEIMKEVGYSQETIDRIVNDALRKHGCHGDIRPSSDEGKILATADGLAHLQSSFLAFAVWGFCKRGKSYEDTKAWVAKKIERDFNNKLIFDDIKEQARPQYETLRMIFSA